MEWRRWWEYQWPATLIVTELYTPSLTEVRYASHALKKCYETTLFICCVCFNFYLANVIPILMPDVDSITDKPFHSLPTNFQLISPATVRCVRPLGSKESCLIFTMRFLGFWASQGAVPIQNGALLTPTSTGPFESTVFIPRSQRYYIFKPKAKITNPDYTASIFPLLSFLFTFLAPVG